MAVVRKTGFGTGRALNSRLLMVSVGIGLFVIGFIVAVASSSQMNAGGSRVESGAPLPIDNEDSGGAADVSVLAGIITSLAGVIVATVGPTISVMRNRGRVGR